MTNHLVLRRVEQRRFPLLVRVLAASLDGDGSHRCHQRQNGMSGPEQPATPATYRDQGADDVREPQHDMVPHIQLSIYSPERDI